MTGDAADAVQVDESLTDLAALAEYLDRDGQAVLALLVKPLVVQPFDGVVERAQLIAVAIRDAQGVINGLGPVSAQADRVVPVLDQPEFDRIGDRSSSYGSFGARLVRSLHPQALRHERRRLLLERVPLAGDLEHDLHSAEPISAIVGECVPGQQLRPLRRMRNVNDPNASSAERLVAAGVSGVQLEGSARTFSPVAAVGRGAPPAAKRDSSQPGVPLQAA